MTTNWNEWHEAYLEPNSTLLRRLFVVQRMIREYCDAVHIGPVKVLSLCSGDGRDIVGAVADHPRRDDIEGRLEERDTTLVQRARDNIHSAGIGGLSVRQGDAGKLDNVTDVLPVHLVLACGIFGNIPDEDVRTTIAALAHFGNIGLNVIWTRHRYDPDLTPLVRGWFRGAGFEEMEFVRVADSHACVGRHVLVTEPRGEAPGGQIFQFFADRVAALAAGS